METVLFLSYFVGVIVAVMVIRSRAGVGVVHRLKVFGSDGFGPVWFAKCVVAAMFWPVTLVRWLLQGRPEPRVVFNDKALERERRLMAGNDRI